MTTAFSPRREHQVARLDVAVDHALLVRVLETQGRLVGEEAGVGHGQRAAGLDHLRQVEPVDVLHREDEALVDPERVVRRHDVRVPEPGHGADLAEEAVEDLGVRHLPPMTLSTSMRPMSVFSAR